MNMSGIIIIIIMVTLLPAIITLQCQNYTSINNRCDCNLHVIQFNLFIHYFSNNLSFYY